MCSVIRPLLPSFVFSPLAPLENVGVFFTWISRLQTNISTHGVADEAVFVVDTSLMLLKSSGKDTAV